jgi:hypothetical protein
MDESGVHGGAPAVTCSAVWARPSVWKNWTREWCRAKRPINIFHASECHNRKGEFDGWSREERNKLVLGLLPLFPKNKLNGRFAGIHLSAFDKAMEGELAIHKEVFGNPYFATIHWTLKAVCEAAQRGNSNRVAIFHEVSDYRTDVQRTFEYIQGRFPGLDMTLNFGTKQQYVPLQAADLVAYEGYKYLETGVQRKPMMALDPTGTRMFASIYDQNTVLELAKGIRQHIGIYLENLKRRGQPLPAQPA